jgi:gas vesicle protein
MKTTLILTLAGALIGVVAASFIVPPALAWYTTPGGLPKGAEVQAVVQISEVIQYSTSKLLWGQFIGGAIGAAAGLITGIVSQVKSRQTVAVK